MVASVLGGSLKSLALMRVVRRCETTERVLREKGDQPRGASARRIRDLPYTATWRLT